jgi:hypothetical protein
MLFHSHFSQAIERPGIGPSKVSMTIRQPAHESPVVAVNDTGLAKIVVGNLLADRHDPLSSNQDVPFVRLGSG